MLHRREATRAERRGRGLVLRHTLIDAHDVVEQLAQKRRVADERIVHREPGLRVERRREAMPLIFLGVPCDLEESVRRHPRETREIPKPSSGRREADVLRPEPRGAQELGNALVEPRRAVARKLGPQDEVGVFVKHRRVGIGSEEHTSELQSPI